MKIELPANLIFSAILALVSGAVGYWFNEYKSKHDRRRKQDQKIYDEFMALLDKNKLIAYIKDRDPMGGYPSDIHWVMEEINEFCSNPKNVFVDGSLKKKQFQLCLAIKNFNKYLADKSAVNRSNPNRSRVVSSQGYVNDLMKGPPQEEWKQIGQKLNELADEVLSAYSQLVDVPKKRL